MLFKIKFRIGRKKISSCLFSLNVEDEECYSSIGPKVSESRNNFFIFVARNVHFHPS